MALRPGLSALDGLVGWLSGLTRGRKERRPDHDRLLLAQGGVLCKLLLLLLLRLLLLLLLLLLSLSAHNATSDPPAYPSVFDRPAGTRWNEAPSLHTSSVVRAAAARHRVARYRLDAAAQLQDYRRRRRGIPAPVVAQGALPAAGGRDGQVAEKVVDSGQRLVRPAAAAYQIPQDHPDEAPRPG